MTEIKCHHRRTCKTCTSTGGKARCVLPFRRIVKIRMFGHKTEKLRKNVIKEFRDLLK